MLGYNLTQSALGVSRLIAFAGNHLVDGLRLADLMIQPGNYSPTYAIKFIGSLPVYQIWNSHGN